MAVQPFHWTRWLLLGWKKVLRLMTQRVAVDWAENLVHQLAVTATTRKPLDRDRPRS